MKNILIKLCPKVVYHNNRKKYMTIIASLCLFACIAIIVSLMINYKISSNNQSNGTLPGADKIYPAVMYKGIVYYWNGMAGPESKLPKGELPKGYEFVGNIQYINSVKLTNDFQFIATFNSTGKLYYNANINKVCICITTYWLDNAYVMFSTQKR